VEQAIIRRLKPGTLDVFRARARERGTSVEAELRKLIEAEAAPYVKDCEALLRLSDEALAMSPPDGPVDASDSTLLIRWDRDTNHGKWVDDGWTDDAGR
jgi:plasmid stability protein